jgi:hypothetical protein
MIYETQSKVITIERADGNKAVYWLSPNGQIVLLNQQREAPRPPNEMRRGRRRR